jgi:hypothetical protein
MAQQFDIVGSLFGFSPEAVQQQITAEQQKRAMDIAGGVTGGLGPAVFQAARAQEAARGTPLFEMQQDPRLIKARAMSNARQAAAPAFQQGGMVGYMNEYANQLEAAGLTAEAAQARAAAAEEQRKAAESASKVFQQQAAGTASLVKATADKRVPLADRLVDLNTRKANQGLTVEEENERVALESVVKLQAPKESKTIIEGQKNILDIDKDDAKEYRTARTSAEKALPTLNRMQTILNSPEGIIQGTGTEARTGFLKALDTLGISTTAARKAVANTEQFNIEVRNLLQSIIKQFGYNPSNADVRFALESLPNASNSSEGLRAILNALIKANKDQLNESTRALEYYRKNQGSFSGFQRKPEIFSPGAGTRSLSDMTTEELEAMLAAQRGRR